MNWTGLAGRLERKFGLGDNPIAARKVYGHVERLCEQHGDPVYNVVRDMVDYCDTARNPGRTFRAFVLTRIQEHGFNVRGGGGGANSPDLLLRVQEVHSRIGAVPPEQARPGHDPSPAAASDGSAMEMELKRLRAQNVMLQRDLAAIRDPRKGGV
jgi:hypothetical protein